MLLERSSEVIVMMAMMILQEVPGGDPALTPVIGDPVDAQGAREVREWGPEGQEFRRAVGVDGVAPAGGQSKCHPRGAGVEGPRDLQQSQDGGDRHCGGEGDHLARDGRGRAGQSARRGASQMQHPGHNAAWGDGYSESLSIQLIQKYGWMEDVAEVSFGWFYLCP